MNSDWSVLGDAILVCNRMHHPSFCPQCVLSWKNDGCKGEACCKSWNLSWLGYLLDNGLFDFIKFVNMALFFYFTSLLTHFNSMYFFFFFFFFFFFSFVVVGLANVLFLTSENDISWIIYSYFRGS